MVKNNIYWNPRHRVGQRVFDCMVAAGGVEYLGPQNRAPKNRGQKNRDGKIRAGKRA